MAKSTPSYFSYFSKSVIVLLCLLLSGFVVSPANADATDNLNKARHHLRMGKYDDAEKHYQKTLKQQPTSPDALHGLSECHIRRGRFSQAKQVLDQLTQRHPNYAPAYFQLGSLYEAQGDAANAKKSFEQYLQKTGGQLPPDPEIRLKLRGLGLY